MLAPLFLTVCAVLVVATFTATRTATSATRRRDRNRRAAFVTRRPELANYTDVAIRLAADLDPHDAETVVEQARRRGIPAALLNGWAHRHGATVTADAVRAGLSVLQMRRYAHSLAGLDLESIVLQAELQQWSLGPADR